MRIDSSTIGMESARSYRASNAMTRRFSVMEYRGGSLTFQGNGLNAAVSGGNQGGGTNVSENAAGEDGNKATSTLTDWQNRFNVSSTRVNMRSSSTYVSSNIRQLSLRYIFDMLFASRHGRLKEWLQEERSMYQQSQSGQGMQQTLSFSQGASFEEAESTSFSTVGTVRTSDGREINFNVNVGMSREFQEYYKDELNLASFQMCDPLVINMDTDVAQLEDQTFYFDIDADGKMDEISQLGSGSGYLALDKNGDGTINDGSELFGTSSGNGFADLAKYDEDGNGWIDENDAVWSKLKIWCKDKNGNDVLYRLADKGVGAICLQNAATDFTLKGSTGQTTGAIRNTGVFLYENGNVGTVQHVDVAKYSQGA